MRNEIVCFGFGFSLAACILRLWLLESGLPADPAFLLQVIGFVVAIIGAFIPKRCPSWEEAKRWGRV